MGYKPSIFLSHVSLCCHLLDPRELFPVCSPVPWTQSFFSQETPHIGHFVTCFVAGIWVAVGGVRHTGQASTVLLTSWPPPRRHRLPTAKGFLTFEQKEQFTPHLGPFWRRKWQPTPVFMPGKSHGPRSLMGYNPWGRKESDTTEWLLCVLGPFKSSVSTSNRLIKELS